MKKKYSEILKESLISFDGMQKTSHTVNDILNYKGNGLLPTHKKANNVVSVLERMYHQEDGDLPVVKEGEETEVAQGAGPETKAHNDVKKTNVSTVATQATGVAHVSPQKKDELKKTIIDATKDDKTLATESADAELSSIPGEDDCVDCVAENAIFEEGDAEEGAAEIEHENLENEPDNEAVGADPKKTSRAMKIGDGGASLANDETIGDDEIDGMEKESEGLPEENRLPKNANVNEEYEDAEEPSEEEVPETEETDDEEMSRVPGEDDETEEETGDEKLEEEMNEEEMQEETDETGGDEEVEDGMDEVPGEEPDEEAPEGEEHGEEAPEEMEEGEAQGIVGHNSEDDDDELSREPSMNEEEIPTHDETEETPEEEAEETPETQQAEEDEGTEAHTLDVDKKARVKESIISRENTEETIVERLIREMNLNADTSSELDEIEIEESFED